jgi:N-acetyl-anhydromuramyl-L-alanine amidase AmpD
MLRNIEYIVVHSTQTNIETDAETLRDSLKANGQKPKYHYLIDRFGYCMRLMGCNNLANIEFPNNETCFHIALVGGLRGGHLADTRSPVQHHALFAKLKDLKEEFPKAKFIGADHFGGNKNQNPGFDFQAWFEFHKNNPQHWVDYEEDENGKWIFIE